MKKSNTKRNYIFYVVMLLLFVVLSWLVIALGNDYEAWQFKNPGGNSSMKWEHYVPDETLIPPHGVHVDTVAVTPENLSPFQLFKVSLLNHIAHPLPLLLLQLIAILIAVRVFSWIFKYLGQPGVIGEIMAGIALGPSILGYFFPDVFQFLFSPESLEPLNIISQIGLILFMFIIGMELDLGILRKKASETLVISHASIIVPFFMGLVLAYFVYPEFGAGHTDFLPFALFIGISVSITAFPVLARIIQERNLGKTQMGRLAIASAANNDITAWCMLAAIIAIAKAGSVASAGFTLLAAVLYILFMFGLIRPFMKKLGDMYHNQERMTKTLIAFIFLVLILSSYITEVLGIHALFGAFVAGVIMPDNISFRRIMTEKVEDVALVLFLPLFFVFTGLRTEIGLLNTGHLWAVCGIFILISILGKMLGASLSARFVGESWKDSLSIGVLMNTRGLMELIVLNIGYEMGILPSSIYVIFVIMALFTTFMATPSLILIEKLFRRKRRKVLPQAVFRPRILISFARPSNAPIFLRIVHLLCGRFISSAKVTAVHFTIGTETSPMNADVYATVSFGPIRTEARRLGMKIDTEYGVTDHYAKDIVDLVNRDNYNFVLIGGGPSFISDYLEIERKSMLVPKEIDRLNQHIHNQWIFPGETARYKAKRLFSQIPCTFGVFVNRNYEGAQNIGMILADTRDRSLLQYVTAVMADVKVSIRLGDSSLINAFQEELEAEMPPDKGQFSIASAETSFSDFVSGKDLMLISYTSWLNITKMQASLIPLLPSFIVVKPYEQKTKK